MVQVISDSQPESVSGSYSLMNNAILGLALGLAYLGLELIIGVYNGSAVVAGNIAIIIVATIGLVAMIQLRMAQPLIIAIATGAVLWGLHRLTSGLVLVETIAWTIILYVLAYVLFSWITRYTRMAPVLVSILLIILAVRIAANL